MSDGVTWDRLVDILKAYDPQFRFQSERNHGLRGIYHPAIDKGRAMPIDYMGNQPLFTGVLRQIKRRFNLPADIFD